MHLVINQPTDRTEHVTTACIDKLYNLSKNNTLDGTSYLRGSINATAAYEDAVTFLNTMWGPDLIVTASDYYIRFADPEVENTIKTIMNKDEDEGVTESEVATVHFGLSFIDNTRITSFNEFSYFTYENSINSINFSGCTNLESIDLSAIRCTSLYLNNCSSLRKFSTTEDEGCFELPNTVTTLSLRNVPIDVLKIDHSFNTPWNGMQGTSIQKIYVTGGFQIWKDCGFDRVEGTPIHSGTLLYFDNTEVVDLTIPSGTTSLLHDLFINYKGLQSLTIPQSLTSIGERCFKDASNIPTINISDIDAYCAINIGYEGCPIKSSTKLYNNGTLVTSVVCPNTLTSITENFNLYKSITSVTFNTGLITIGVGAFLLCTNLNNFTIPNTVTSIGDSAFLGCTSITEINIPSSVTSIGSDAFRGCTGVTKITLNEGLLTIGSNAFGYYYKTLTYDLEIPSTVTSIGWGAFTTTRTPKVICKAITPPAISKNVFDIYNLLLYVPDLSVDTYKTATNWSEYASYIHPISELSTQ